MRSDSWNAWALPWKVPISDGRHLHLALGLADGLRGGAERHALRQVEADGDGRELALVADRQRLGLARGPLGEGRQRHLLPGGRRLDVDLVEAVHVALQLGQDLHHHVVAVLLREVLRHLALAEGVVERVVDELRREAVAGGLVAVDGEGQRRAGRSAGPMATSRSSGSDLSFSSTLGAHSFSSSRLASCSVYWNCVRDGAAADVDVLRRLQEEPRALHLLQLRPQPGDDLDGRDIALARAASA